MKKVLLLLAGGVMSLSVSAQSQSSVGAAAGFNVAHQSMPVTANGKAVSARDLRSTHRTTTGATSRWYNYGQYLDTSTYTTDSRTALSAPYMWNDTASQDIYSGPTLAHNDLVSVALFLDPYFSGFYDALYYDPTVEMQMNSTKAYTVDSVTIYGVYGINPSKTAVVDTITVGYTYGTGTPLTNTEDIWRDEFDISFAPASLLTNYGLATTDSLWFKQVFYDSTINTIGGLHDGKQIITCSYNTGTSSNTNFLWSDTTSGGAFIKTIGLTTPMAVPAGNMVAFTLSFKSGDASFTFGDTVFTGIAGRYYKYNMLRPYVLYYTDGAGSSTAAFAPYTSGAGNQGSFKTLPNFAQGWKNIYVPMYAWSTNNGANASTYQYPFMDVHIKCPTCGSVSTPQVSGTQSINAFPNPTADLVTVNFTSTKAGNTTVTLTNMTGQTVASQNLGNVTNGTATFSTATLPNGVYIYSAMQNGTRTTGRIVVAH